MRTAPRVCAYLLVIQLPALSQSIPARLSGLEEPPEFSGEPKRLVVLTQAQRAFGEIISSTKEQDKKQVQAVVTRLAGFIGEHPEYSDAYIFRAMWSFCELDTRDYLSVLKDIDKAISTHSSESIFQNLATHHALRAKLNLVLGRHREAVDDLEKAIRVDFIAADKIFNLAGVEPEQKASKPCAWSLADLAALATALPGDYRPTAFRGLYWMFFSTFNEDYYQKALLDFQKAAKLAPRSPLPPYFIGTLHTKMAFWTRAAWSSDEAKEAARKKAVEAYTVAIRLDQQFLPAYEERANALLGLKQLQQAIRDYDRILELDPGNITAYADRGLAHLEAGHYLRATFDFGEAIRRKQRKEEDSNIGMTYEYRGDAYMKVGDYRRAIEDYSKAIERRLANDTFLLNLTQVRALYPEYANVSDEALISKIRTLFWPEFELAVLTEQLQNNPASGMTSLLLDLYEKRGDAYLRAGDFNRGARDFHRIFSGVPHSSDTVERWREIGSSADGEKFYVDVKSLELRDGEYPRLWIKFAKTNRNSVVQAFQLDCKGRRINQLSTVVYDPSDKLLSSSEFSGGWKAVVPSTIGEQLYGGLCSSTR